MPFIDIGAKWLSPSLFYIPTGNGQQQVTINTNIQQSAITTQQFYSLNLQKLKKITREIQQKSQKLSFKNGNISSYIYSKENTYLYSTISVERGWTVKVNDKVIHPQVFAGTFMRLPIKAGNNKISMTYKTPYLGLGIIISILSIILIIMYLIIIKKYI